MDFKTSIVLENEALMLRPFALADLEELYTIALDEDIWRLMTTRITSREELEAWGRAAKEDREKAQRYVFTLVDKASGRLAGSTAFGNVSAHDKRLEIGWTWLGKDFRGSGINRHAKFLLLSYAFDTLRYERVELKTDVLNMRSRKAMFKIGATEEGVLRSHTIMQDGRRRDTIYYSILRGEWPQIRSTFFGDL